MLTTDGSDAIKKAMKSCQLVSPKKLEVVEIPMPLAANGEVIVRMKAVGVCGSDIHYWHDGRIGSTVCRYPQRLGHEPCGVVEEAPSDSRFKAGDRVVIEPGRSCMTCEHCLAGRHNICPNVVFLGGPGTDGASQEFLAVSEHQLELLPDTLYYEEGALLEPLGVGYHAVALAGLRPAETVGIFGCGAVGLCTLVMAKAVGCGTVFVTDTVDARLKMAVEQFGADHMINVNHTDALTYINDHTHGRGLDCTFDAAGKQESITHTFEAARIGGRALIIGIPEEPQLTFNPHTMRRKELAVWNVRRSNKALAPCIDLASRGVVKIKPMATHGFSLEELEKGFQISHDYSHGVVRAMLRL